MRGLKIVLVMVEPPLPFGNAASRWFYVLLRQLVERGHHVTAFAACSKEREIEETRDLFPADQYTIHLYPFPPRRRLAGKLTTVLKPYSFQFGADLKRDLANSLQGGYDILHIEQLWAGWLGRGHNPRALLNVHHLQTIDLEFAKVRPLKEKINHRLIFSTERKLIGGYDFIRTSSPRLVPRIRGWNPRATVDTVPLGIDASLYRFLPDEQRATAKVISLIGSMTWYPGQSAAFRLLDRLWPRIREAVPEARLQIVGWSARSVLSDYLDLPNVDVFEDVPNIQPYFDDTSLMLYAPARGSGMKVKVLEALAFGIPVVTTSEGSEGIPAVDGVHMALSDEDDGLVGRAIELLRSPEKQNEMRSKGRQLLEQHCGPEKTVDQLEGLYRRMIEAGRRRSARD